MQSNDTPVTKELKHGTLIVDAIDADLLPLSWYTWATKTMRTFYIRRPIRGAEKISFEYMHRVIGSRIINREILQSEVVDHINGNGLDNRRCNLRVCSRRENLQNRVNIARSNTSGYTGVEWHKQQEKWVASITIRHEDGRPYHKSLGLFDDIQEAAKARRAAELEYYGEFAPHQATSPSTT